jgi:hypothetical protein
MTSIVPECAISHTNKFSKIYYDCNVWFGVENMSNKKISIIRRPFHIVKNDIKSPYSEIKNTEVFGQFITSMWYSNLASIQMSYTFYVIAIDKSYKRESVEELVNMKNCIKSKFVAFDKFTLSSERLYSTFDTMLITNNQTKRINLYSNENHSHVLNIHLSIKHLFTDNENATLLNETGMTEETVVIDTPTITYT